MDTWTSQDPKTNAVRVLLEHFETYHHIPAGTPPELVRLVEASLPKSTPLHIRLPLQQLMHP